MDEKKCCTIIQNYNCGCCGTSGADNIYSTEETVCGTWIDGKPIYRKVIEGKLASASGTGLVFANVSDINIDRVISLSGNFIGTNRAHNEFPVSFNDPRGLHAAVNMFYLESTKEIRYHYVNGGYYAGCTAYVILEYTKQDDEAV